MSKLPKIIKQFLKIPLSFKTYTTMQSFTEELQQNPSIYKVEDPRSITIARNCLRSGNVIALPTDTVYGLACDANNEKAIQNLYNIKGRDFHKPVAICVKDLADLRKYGQAEHLNDSLLEQLLPGAITIVIERSKHLSNPFLNPTTSKIGIRIPDFEFIQQLCASFDEQPLALTSANRSSERSSLNIKEFDVLWPLLGGIFDAGQVGLTEERRSASTVVDLATPGLFKIVREGVALKQTLDVLHAHGLKSFESTRV
ncbi:yrdC domain-containing protein, mitochondrial [Lucilia cuprina]|uniref:yrdC domain-containing protein, mitochondrial n=1 Tax=Lucilia cuprina TaxID=7375 RepID=UPI001F05554B|nr:yrdC domain-containing protein, mitochondrial [Lucilia cuprina]